MWGWGGGITVGVGRRDNCGCGRRDNCGCGRRGRLTTQFCPDDVHLGMRSLSMS